MISNLIMYPLMYIYSSFFRRAWSCINFTATVSSSSIFHHKKIVKDRIHCRASSGLVRN